MFSRVVLKLIRYCAMNTWKKKKSNKIISQRELSLTPMKIWVSTKGRGAWGDIVFKKKNMNAIEIPCGIKFYYFVILSTCIFTLGLWEQTPPGNSLHTLSCNLILEPELIGPGLSFDPKTHSWILALMLGFRGWWASWWVGLIWKSGKIMAHRPKLWLIN